MKKATRRSKLMIGNRILTLVRMLNAGHKEMAQQYDLLWNVDKRKLADVPVSQIRQLE